MVSVKTSVMSAIKLGVIIKAGVVATARANSVIQIFIYTSGMSAITIIMVARTHISGTVGTLIMIALLAGVMTAAEHSVLAYFKVFAANITVVNYRLTAARVITRAEISTAISAICMFTVHTSGVSAT